MVVGAVLTMGDAVGSEIVEHALEHILHQPLFVSLQMSVTGPYGIVLKLKERNAGPSIIADEQALIDQNKACIEQLDKQIAELQESSTPD